MTNNASAFKRRLDAKSSIKISFHLLANKIILPSDNLYNFSFKNARSN